MFNSIDEVAPPNIHSESTKIADIFDERESNVRSYSRSFPATFTSAKGAHLTDVTGRSFIDFLAGAGCTELRTQPTTDTIKSALVDYSITSDGLTHGLDLLHNGKAALSRGIRLTSPSATAAAPRLSRPNLLGR